MWHGLNLYSYKFLFPAPIRKHRSFITINLINNSFLEPMKFFCALNATITGSASLTEDLATIPLTTPQLRYHNLKLLNRSKAPGPDAIPN